MYDLGCGIGDHLPSTGPGESKKLHFNNANHAMDKYQVLLENHSTVDVL